MVQKVQIHTKTKAMYPHLVSAEQFGALNCLRARLDRSTIGESFFLGYFRVHKEYYVDHNHTNEKIRCPICDEEWLIGHNSARALNEANLLRGR